MTRNRETFEAFKQRIEKEVLSHRIIKNNEYCNWFKQSQLSLADVQHFSVQFSVFSNLFLIAQLKKVLNAPNLASMRDSKEILLSELGVIFNRRSKESEASVSKRKANSEIEGDPELVNTEGSIDGGTFKFAAAHFEWLLKYGSPLGLEFKDLGKRAHGTKSTLFFCDELERIYGSADYSTSSGASYAVENWANRGFWKDLIAGLQNFKQQSCPKLHLGFFTWHDKVEDQHAAHTQHELEEAYFAADLALNEDQFIKSAQEMLEGVAAFWDGLNADRIKMNKKSVSA